MVRCPPLICRQRRPREYQRQILIWGVSPGGIWPGGQPIRLRKPGILLLSSLATDTEDKDNGSLIISTVLSTSRPRQPAMMLFETFGRTYISPVTPAHMRIRHRCLCGRIVTLCAAGPQQSRQLYKIWANSRRHLKFKPLSEPPFHNFATGPSETDYGPLGARLRLRTVVPYLGPYSDKLNREIQLCPHCSYGITSSEPWTGWRRRLRATFLVRCAIILILWYRVMRQRVQRHSLRAFLTALLTRMRRDETS